MKIFKRFLLYIPLYRIVYYKMVQRAALTHYSRMINWAKTQPQDDNPAATDMRKSIQDYWGTKTCAYCNAIDAIGLYGEQGCKACCLYAKHSADVNACCGGLFAGMARAKTWREWILYAEFIYLFIEYGGIHGYKSIPSSLWNHMMELATKGASKDRRPIVW